MVRSPTVFFRLIGRWLLSAVVAVASLAGADTRPVVGPGASREDVINAYGWPTGQGRLGTKEVLNYPQGTVTLADGKVERVDFSPNVPWATPKPRPAPASPTSVKRPEAPLEFWTTSLAEALRDAQARRARILVAFTGSDWSPPSRRFLDEVATSPDFFNAFTADFIFLKADFPTRAAQLPELKKQNEELRARCGVTTYPALIVLSARGEPVGVADIAKERAGSYREQITEAVAEVRDLLKIRAQSAKGPEAAAASATAPAPAAVPAAESKAPAAGGGAGGAESGGMAAAAMSSASWALMVGLGGGALLAAGLVWWIWRTRVQLSSRTADGPKFTAPSVRLADVPTHAELCAWPVARLRTLVAAHFEATGYKTQIREHEGEPVVELMRPGHTKPSVLVACRPGDAVTEAKAVGEFFGTLVSSGIANGWLVAAAGYTPEAHQLAAERGIELIDGDGLIGRLRALDPLMLERVLGRVGA